MAPSQAAPAPAPAPSSAPQKIKGRKGKAGGTGKKGKVFVEGKADLLSLMSEITSSKADQASSRVAKRKAVIQSEGDHRSEVGSKKGLKAAERDKALESAKAALLEKQRLKRLAKKPAASAPAAAATEGGKDDKPKKKRVGFA